jgi:hypothetical protein
MANVQTGPVDISFVDKRRGRDWQSPALSDANNYDSITEMRARLQTVAPATFTVARLDLMTVNDMVYAVRVHAVDSAGI